MQTSRLTRFVSHVLFFIALCLISQTRGEVSRGENHFVIDGVKFPVGSEIEVIGPLLYKGRPDQSDARGAVQGTWINGKANQNQVHFHLGSEKRGGWPGYKDIQALERGAFYRMRGQIVDGRIDEKKTAITLIVRQLDKTEPRQIMFADLINRNTTFTGIAAENGTLVTEQGQAKMQGMEQWPHTLQGKQIFVRGTLRQRLNGFQIEQATWHPTNLELLVGKPVSLEGTLWDRVHPRFMKYDKQFLYLSYPPSRRMTFLQKFANRRVPVRVCGTLVKEPRPPLKWSGPDLEVPFQSCYVIRDARVEYLLPAGFQYDEYKTIYSRRPPVSRGVPELIAEYPPPGNRQINPADAMMYVRRNEETIQSILTNTTTQTRNILAERMQDSRQPATLCKIYAAMLAHLNDQRGRDFLLRSLQDHSPNTFPDTVYCLGAILSLGTEKTRQKTELNWAEETMLELLRNQDQIDISRYYGAPAGKFQMSIADASMLYSELYKLFIQINSPATHKTLLDYVLTEPVAIRHSVYGPYVLSSWLDSKAAFTSEELLQLEMLPDRFMGQRFNRRRILSRLLQKKQYQILEQYLTSESPYEYYSELRVSLTPELVGVLRDHLKNLQGDAKDMVELLIILQEPDPVPLIIQNLVAYSWKKNHLALYELVQFGDRRAVTPVARLLQTAPPEFFDLGPGYICTLTIDRAFEVIRLAEPRQEVHELIKLLSVNFSHSKSCRSHQYYQREIALRLINLTGVSLGTDQKAWQDWEQTEYSPINPVFKNSEELE